MSSNRLWYPRAVDPHRRAELRSLAYHRAIAARIADDPAIVERARARVATWQRTGQTHPEWTAVWARLLAQPVDEIGAAIVEVSEAMTAARQSSPFAGAISARDRWDLWRRVDR